MKTRTKRKRHRAACKARVGREAVIGIKTVDLDYLKKWPASWAREPVARTGGCDRGPEHPRRLWRRVKHEDVYLQDYLDGLAHGRGLVRWFKEYNFLRPHQSQSYATPGAVYQGPDACGAKAWKR